MFGFRSVDGQLHLEMHARISRRYIGEGINDAVGIGPIGRHADHQRIAGPGDVVHDVGQITA